MRRRRRVLRLALVLAVTVCGAVHAAASVPDEALDMAPDESPDESSICQHWRDSLAQNDAAAFPWIRVDDQSALPVNIPWTHSSSPHVVYSAARSLSPPLEEGTPFPVDSIHARDRIEFAVVVVQRRQWWRSSSTDVQLSLSSAVSLGSTDDDDDDKVKHVTYFSRMARGRRFLPRRKPVGDGWLATGEPQTLVTPISLCRDIKSTLYRFRVVMPDEIGATMRFRLSIRRSRFWGLMILSRIQTRTFQSEPFKLREAWRPSLSSPPTHARHQNIYIRTRSGHFKPPRRELGERLLPGDVTRLPFGYVDTLPATGEWQSNGAPLMLRFFQFKTFSPIMDRWRWTDVMLRRVRDDAIVYRTSFRASVAPLCDVGDVETPETLTNIMTSKALRPLSAVDVLGNAASAQCRFPSASNTSWTGRTGFQLLKGEMYVFRVDIHAMDLPDGMENGYHYVHIRNHLRLEADDAKTWWKRMGASPLALYNRYHPIAAATGFMYIVAPRRRSGGAAHVFDGYSKTGRVDGDDGGDNDNDDDNDDDAWQSADEGCASAEYASACSRQSSMWSDDSATTPRRISSASMSSRFFRQQSSTVEFRSPLHECARDGRFDLCRAMLEGETAVDVQHMLVQPDANGNLPIHLSISGTANANAMSATDANAMSAADTLAERASLFQLLLRHTPDDALLHANTHGDTLLHLIVKHDRSMTNFNRLHVRTQRRSLRGHFAHLLHARNALGDTALFYCRTTLMCDELTRKGARVAVYNEQGDTPLDAISRRPLSFCPERAAILKLLANRERRQAGLSSEGTTASHAMTEDSNESESDAGFAGSGSEN